MMTKLRVLTSILAIVTFSNAGSTQDHNALNIVSMIIRGPVQAVSAHGKFVIAYEVDIFNRTKMDLPLSAFEVLDGNGLRLLRYDKSVLQRHGRQFAPRAANLRIPLKAGARAILFCWLEMPSSDQPPGILQQRLMYGNSPNNPQRIELTTPVLPLADLSLGSPVAPGKWLAGNGPSSTSEHRTAQIRIDGNPDAPFAQRYAIDWVGVCAGELFRNKGTANTDYCSYGSDAIAVADGTIAAVRDDIAENKPGEGSRAIPMTKDTILGNYVILDLGQQRYAVYAHLQPRSIQVKVGATVKRGQPVGRIGNTGNSDAPHLHFHVGRAASLIEVTTGQTEPVPYVFEKFERVGNYSGKGPIRDLESDIRALEIPLEGDIIRFFP